MIMILVGGPWCLAWGRGGGVANFVHFLKTVKIAYGIGVFLYIFLRGFLRILTFKKILKSKF